MANIAADWASASEECHKEFARGRIARFGYTLFLSAKSWPSANSFDNFGSNIQTIES
jgi:hypothetical protein